MFLRFQQTPANLDLNILKNFLLENFLRVGVFTSSHPFSPHLSIKAMAKLLFFFRGLWTNNTVSKS